MAADRRVVLFGYAGGQNLGDEAILAGTLALLRARAEPCTPVVVSLDAADTERRHQVVAWPRRRLLALLRSLGPDDRFLLGGGGLLQDATSAGSLAYYLKAAAAAGRRCPVGYWAIGAGPLSAIGQWMLRQAPWPAVAVGREEDTLAILRRAGLPPDRLVRGADAAYALTPRAARKRAGGWIGFAPRSAPGVDVAAIAARVVERARRSGRRVRIVAMDQREDLALARQLAQTLAPWAEFAALPEAPEGIPAVFSELDYVVAVRLHALILAALAGVPGVAVAYDPKVEREARLLGMPLWSEWTDESDTPPHLGHEPLGAVVAARRELAAAAFSQMWQALA